MAIRIKTADGTWFEVDTLEEAEALKKFIKSFGRPKRRRIDSDRTMSRRVKLAISLLQSLNSSKRPLTSEQVVKTVGLQRMRSLPGFVKGCVNLISIAGFDPKDAFSSERTGDGSRLWFPGTRIEEIIASLRLILEDLPEV